MSGDILRDRIVELVRVPANQLEPNANNWRTHPQYQRDALSGLLGEVGIVGAAIARRDQFGQLILIDGHLRREVIDDQPIPVLVLDVDEDEAALLLATYDPISAMAESNHDALVDLLASVETHNPALQHLIDDLAGWSPPEHVDEPMQPEPNTRGNSHEVRVDGVPAADRDRLVAAIRQRIDDDYEIKVF